MNPMISRRAMMAGAGALVGAGALPATAPPQDRPREEPFGYCLNTGTLIGFKLPLPQQIDVAAEAGWKAIEPWTRDIDQFVKSGGSLNDIGKRCRDKGITVESAIGFPAWVVDDDARRARGMEDMKRDMDLVAQIGGKRIAAPPAGAPAEPRIDLYKAAERYRAVCELGEQTGVTPVVEFWGGAKNILRKLSETVFVAVESGHPKAGVLPDVFHLYKGRSGFDTLKLLGGGGTPMMHVNDYPANPPREQIKDSERVYPGDGVAPLDRIFRDLYANGFRGFLSLELFNQEYWKTDPATVARTGLEKTRAAVRKAFS